MTLKGFFRFIGCLGLAAGVTTGIYLVDAEQWNLYQSRSALNWARQISAQAEGMAFSARQKGEADPIGWAVNFLTQGNEPRIMKVKKVILADDEADENSQISSPKTFTYTKLFTAEDKTGIRVEIALDYVGFLGAKTRIANDLLVLAVFLFSFAFIFMV